MAFAGRSLTFRLLVLSLRGKDVLSKMSRMMSVWSALVVTVLVDCGVGVGSDLGRAVHVVLRDGFASEIELLQLGLAPADTEGPKPSR